MWYMYMWPPTTNTGSIFNGIRFISNLFQNISALKIFFDKNFILPTWNRKAPYVRANNQFELLASWYRHKPYQMV